MSLKHLTRLNVPGSRGDLRLVYIDDQGVEVEALSRFKQHLDGRGYGADTIKRYHEAAGRFLDYLIECRAFGAPAQPSDIAEAVDAYPAFLRDGAAIDWPELPSLATYAEEIGFHLGLARNSFTPVMAAVNHFLRFSRDEALKTEQTLRDGQLTADWLDLRITFAAIEGVVRWSRAERDRLRQQTMIGAVVRVRDKLVRPRRLRNPLRGDVQVDLESKEFPLGRLSDLLSEARSHRDRALWALLASGGLRIHEALNLRLSDVDAATGELWVLDPANHRFGREMTPGQKVRFKGRAMSRVYLFEPLRTVFWEALDSYLRTEFVPSASAVEEHLFKKIDGSGRGRPLVEASDTALEKQFKKAVVRSRVPGPKEAPRHVWTLHSLRHSYGVYMLNYLPVPGGPGLRLTEVQMLMGHRNVESTAVYARHDRVLLEAKVEAANDAIFSGVPGDTRDNLALLPASIANRLREVANQIDGQGRFAS